MMATQASELKPAKVKPIFSQPRFSREMYEEMRKAAKSEGLAISTWIRRVCALALQARQKN